VVDLASTDSDTAGSNSYKDESNVSPLPVVTSASHRALPQKGALQQKWWQSFPRFD
jgi:hypothetical protein